MKRNCPGYSHLLPLMLWSDLATKRLRLRHFSVAACGGLRRKRSSVGRATLQWGLCNPGARCCASVSKLASPAGRRRRGPTRRRPRRAVDDWGYQATLIELVLRCRLGMGIATARCEVVRWVQPDGRGSRTPRGGRSEGGVQASSPRRRRSARVEGLLRAGRSAVMVVMSGSVQAVGGSVWRGAAYRPRRAADDAADAAACADRSIGSVPASDCRRGRAAAEIRVSTVSA